MNFSILMSAAACIGAACGNNGVINFLDDWCPVYKTGGIKGLLAVSCLVLLNDETAVQDFLNGNPVDYRDLVADPTGATIAQATLDELVALGLVGTFFKNAIGSLTNDSVTTDTGACGKEVITNTVWAYEIKSKSFDETANMYDMQQYNDYLKNYEKYDLFFVTCQDGDKAIHIPASKVELTEVNYTVPETNKENQEKQIKFLQTLAGACVPPYLPAPAIANLQIF